MPFTISSSSHTPNSSNLLAPRAITFNVVGDSMSAQHLPPMSAEPHCLVTSPPKPPEPLKRAAVRDFSTQSIHLGTWAFPTGGGEGICFPMFASTKVPCIKYFTSKTLSSFRSPRFFFIWKKPRLPFPDPFLDEKPLAHVAFSTAPAKVLYLRW